MRSSTSTVKAFTAAKYGAAGLLAGSSLLAGGNAFAEEHPNIVFILADDLGWTGINCHDEGCTGIGNNCTCSDDASKWDSHFYETPNIRELIREAGVRFTRAYVCPSSQATRAGIMTGKCPLRYPYGITLPEVTIAEAVDMYVGDYVSAIIGKGHLNTEWDQPHPRHYDPYRQGFDYQFAGGWTGMGGNLGRRYFGGSSLDAIAKWRDYWEPDPNYYIEKYGNYFGDSPGWYQEDLSPAPPYNGIAGLYFPGLGDPNPYGVWTPNMNEYDPNREYMTDALGDRAVQFVETFGDGGSNEGKPFFLYLAFFAPHAPVNWGLNGKPQFPYTFSGDDNRHDHDHDTYYDPNFTDSNYYDPNDYAAMIRKMDDNIGKVLNALYLIDPNAIVIFCSDNGGAEGLGLMSHTDNDPLRSGKGSFYEGGIRVPLIVRWPNVAPEDTTCNVPVNLCDFLPTIVNMAQGDAYDADKLPLIDGTSFVPLLKAPTATSLARKGNFFVLGGGDGLGRAVIFGTGVVGVVNGVQCDGYKLIKTDSLLNDNPNNYTYELYNIPNDVGEDANLVNNPAYAAVASELSGALEGWLNSELRPYNARLPKYYRPEYSGNYLVKGAIQKAMEAAVNGDTIQIPPATFLESGSYQSAEGLKIGQKRVTLRSRDPEDWRIVESTVIARKSKYGPVIKFDGTYKNECVIKGITITGGYHASNNAGGIDGGGASGNATISNCIISYNFVGGNGAGVYDFDGTIANCTIHNNTAKGGGGGLAGCNGTVKNCLIYANAASEGGAMNGCQNTTISGCTVVGNIAKWQSGGSAGGGIKGATGNIANCILAYNNGHAIYEPDGNSSPASVKNCLFYENPDGDWYNGGTTSYKGPTEVIPQNIPEVSNPIFNAPAFANCFDFVDHIQVTQDGWSTVCLSSQQGSDQTTLPIEDVDEQGYEYAEGDIIEFNNDGVSRQIIDVNSTDNTITFTPAYLMEDCADDVDGTADDMRGFTIPSEYVVLYKWPDGTTNVIEDFHLLNTSPCINAGLRRSAHATVADGTTTTVNVADASGYSVKDVLGLGNAYREVTNVDTVNGVVTFAPSVAASNTLEGRTVENWGQIGLSDIDGDTRVYAGHVDIGADEAAPLARRVAQSVTYWYYKIQDAINAAGDGETITVYPGLYKESLDFTGKSVTVEGSDPDNWETIAATIIDPNAVE